jgi:multidrug efflux pump subunit AcrA (membrane-fusion protein)
MFPPVSKIDNTTVNYMPSFNKKTYPVYYAALLIVIVFLISLPLIRTTIAITTRGIIRPQSERTTVKTVIGGIIDTLYYREGSSIYKGSSLLRIKDPISKGKRTLNRYEISQHTQCIHELRH